jgi:hypothetical protein
MKDQKKSHLVLYINPVTLPEENLLEIRSNQTYSLLAKRCDEGVLLYDRKSRLHHLLSWEDMQYPQAK